MSLVRVIVMLFLLGLSLTADAASLADKFTPGTSYYFDTFDPSQKIWKPGQSLNVEEVFKNYEYYEIVLSRNGKDITVHHYIRGEKVSSEKYLALPDGSLRKKRVEDDRDP